MRLRSASIKTRLTMWHIAVFSLVLFLYIAGACVLHYWQLSEQLYQAEVQDLETVEGLLYFAPDGRLLLHDDYHGHPESHLLLDRLMEVMDQQGRVLLRNEKLAGQDLGGPPLSGEFSVRYFARHITVADGTRVLSISHLHLYKGRPLLMRVAYSTEPLRIWLLEFLGDSVLVMPLALCAVGLAGYRMSGKALKPLEDMACLTERISASSLSARLPVENPNDEFGHMARVLNALLGRLEESFTKLKRFTADVSHELRTPLASLRSVGEVGLELHQDTAGYRDIIGSMLEEVTRLTSMIDTLFTISRAESGEIKLVGTEFPLLSLVQETVSVVAVLAEEKRQTISIDGDPNLSVNADRGFLRMALMNLVDNAVKYSPQGSSVRVKWALAENEKSLVDFIELSVEDEGPGIPEEYRQRVFDRFFRVDESRNREAGGAGLGLSIAKWAVEAHGGQVRLASEPGVGTVFTIQLPTTRPAR